MARKKKKEEAKGGGWIVSFADLMTLLFAAFVVLFALKKEGAEPTPQVIVTAAAIREAFNEVPDDIPEEKNTVPDAKGKVVFENIRAEIMAKPIITKYERKDRVFNVITKDLQEIKELIKMLISNKRESRGKEGAISVHREDDGIRVRLMATHFYKRGQVQIDRKALKTMDQIGKLLKTLGRRVTIEGHTDNQPMVGKYSKWELSALRASYVLKYFIDDLEFPSNKITAAGYADTKPQASNDTPEGRAMNRRLEIKLHYD